MIKQILSIFFLLIFLSGIVSAAIWTPSLNNELKAFWKLNETSGNVVLDSYNRTDPDGKWNATSSYINFSFAGIINGSYNMSNDESEILIMNYGNITANSTSFIWNTTTQNMTLSFWINYDDLANSDNYMIWSYGDEASYGGRPECIWRVANSVQTFVQCHDGVADFAFTYDTSAGYTGHWIHHVLQVTNDGTGNATLWINGTVINSDSTVDFNMTGYNVTSGFGNTRMNGFAVDKSFRGQIDEIGWWDRYLNATEILQLYNQGLGITYDELIDRANPNLTINEPNTTYSNLTNIPVNITATDENLAYCYFNVTRGASLEVGDTQITNCSTTTFTVSGDANYVFHTYVNDTAGNANYSTASFTITNYVPPPPASSSSGGGGGGYQFNASAILAQLKAKTTTPLCEQKRPAFDTAYNNFLSKTTFSNFRILWYAFWNYSLCKSSASLIPLEVENNATT